MSFILQSPIQTAMESTSIFYAFGVALRILMLTVMVALIVLQQEDWYLKHKSSCALITFFQICTLMQGNQGSCQKQG